MKAYSCVILRKDGTIRWMTFVKLDQLPPEFLALNISGSSPKKKTREGSELVWDVDKNGFRIIHPDSIISPISTIEIDDNMLSQLLQEY